MMPNTKLLSPFVFGTGDTFESVRDCFSTRLLALADKGPELLGLEPHAVVAASLAHLAAAIGRAILFDDGTTTLSPAFNLAVVSDADLQPQWLSTIGRVWTDRVSRLQVLGSTPEFEATLKAMQHASNNPTGPSDPTRHTLANPSVKNAKRMPSAQFTNTKLNSVTLGFALQGSRDHAITLITGATDPAQKWAELPMAQKRQLSEMLCASWDGKPLCLDTRKVDVPATLSCLWQTRLQTVRNAWFSSRGESLVPPVLLFQCRSNPKRLPKVEAMEFVEWSMVLNAVLEHRLKIGNTQAETFQLDADDKELVEVFVSQFATALSSVHESKRPLLRWLPDLVIRIYLTMALCSLIEIRMEKTQSTPNKEQSPKEPPVDPRSTLMQAVRVTRWLIQEHYEALHNCQQTGATDGTCHVTDSTDTVALEECIVTKLKDKGPQDPRELQRCFHDLRAQDRDRALTRLKMNGQVVETTDGRLAAAAA